MKPMGLNSTPFLTFAEIKVDKIDLIEDAFGIDYEFCDVMTLLGILKPVPPKRLTKALIAKIRKQI
jgi:hypothetical protein